NGIQELLDGGQAGAVFESVLVLYHSLIVGSTNRLLTGFPRNFPVKRYYYQSHFLAVTEH
ncbi:MAG: hypothetical protein ACUVQR_14765, partial [Thermogutta sp.]